MDIEQIKRKIKDPWRVATSPTYGDVVLDIHKVGRVYPIEAIVRVKNGHPYMEDGPC